MTWTHVVVVSEDFTKDYTSNTELDFATVFAILFSSVTGILNGANMSGLSCFSFVFTPNVSVCVCVCMYVCVCVCL